MQDSVGGDLTPPSGGGPMAVEGRGSGGTSASPATVYTVFCYF